LTWLLRPEYGRSRKLTHSREKLALTDQQLFAFSTPETAAFFSRAFLSFFHIALDRQPAMDKASSLHLNCQYFLVQGRTA
jgi:hypothetical protein